MIWPTELVWFQLQMEECVAASQRVLAQVIQRTPLTGKLLSRPPFRYIHDLISEIIEATGFAAGLFDASECDSSNVTVLALLILLYCVG